jgi:hypothetical protein
MDEYGAPKGNQKYPFAPLVDRWKRVFASARKDRKKKFDQYADEAMNFFDGPVNHMWATIRGGMRDGQHDGFLAPDVQLPQFEMSVNRLFEAVSMFGPVLYHQNPVIAVTPRVSPEITIETFYAGNPQATQLLEMAQAVEQGIIDDPNIVQSVQALYRQYNMAIDAEDRASVIDRDHANILEVVSNYIQQEGTKQDEARLAITEAIITGLGLLETKVEQPPGGGPKIARSRFRSNKDLLVDPDAKYWRDCTWIALRSCEPVNQVEQKFNLPKGSLKGKYARMSASDNATDRKRNGDGSYAGVTHDLIEYWEVYSKNGAGQNIKLNEKDKKVQGLEALGDFVYLAICEQCPYPLNLAPNVLATGNLDLILERSSWEVPYWDDTFSDGGWPICRLSFYNKPGEIWPISMVKPCIGELKFINWCMSFLADGVCAGSKIYVATMKEAGENIRSQLTSGTGPFSVIDLERISGKSINDVISFLKAPSFNIDIWNMVAQVNEQIDKRLGLTELMYGMSGRQMRSAAEAQYRQQNINIRPDDMASRVEDWLSLSATREIQAMRYVANFDDLVPVIGQTAARVFEEQILTDDVTRITRDFRYRVEAGTARKPNRDTQIAQLTDVGQYILPVIQQAMMSGVTRPYNAYMKALGRAMDMDINNFLLGDEEQQMLVAMNAPPEPAQPQQEAAE